MGGWTWYDYMATPEDVIRDGWDMIAEEQRRYKEDADRREAERVRNQLRIR